jgi:hypothetical protein
MDDASNNFIRDRLEAPKISIKPISKSNPSKKPICSISLGNDSNDWVSVTKSSMIEHPMENKREMTEYEVLEKKKSTVLDNPDLKLGPMQSVHKAVYQISSNLDRSSLTYDNTLSKEALTGTNFTVDIINIVGK